MAGDFSKTFAQVLRGVMTEQGITVEQVAERLGRSTGFVSERTRGIRPVDTDIVDAVASLSDQESAALFMEIARRMNVRVEGSQG